MSVTLQDVEHVAQLARLAFTPKEKETFMQQLNKVLAYMEKLNEVDTSNVEPLSHTIELTTALRQDIVRPSFPQSEMLENAPDRVENYFRVPKVIGSK